MVLRITLTTLLSLVSIALLTGQTPRSVLADGDIYKFAVSQDGVYKLDYEFLEDLSINPTIIDPNRINIYGHGGGTLPQENSAERIDDLAPIPIRIIGEEDGTFDQEDYILVYCESADDWSYDQSAEMFQYHKNPYETQNFYFLRIGDQDKIRISTQSKIDAEDRISTAFDERLHYENDLYNLLHLSGDANLQGSGRQWYGDQFKVQRFRDYSSIFDFSGAILSEIAKVRMSFVARSSQTSTVTLNIEDKSFDRSISRSNVGDIEDRYAKIGSISEEFNLGSSSPEINISYPSQGNNNLGWLDYITFQFRKELSFGGAQFGFTDLTSDVSENTKYIIANAASDLLVWDISNPLLTEEVPYSLVTDRIEFVSRQGGPDARFQVFSESTAFTPLAVGKIPNQNLHGISNIDYLVIYHPDFEEAAARINTHRVSHSRFNVGMASIEEVFNEFSSGKVDPTAIRDFARLQHKRSVRFKYMLLIGDGSFDYRHILTDLPDESFIPVYETDFSLDPIGSYPSDDYYALLSDNEGGENLRGALDIAVGRFPVRTADEAILVANKVINYETSAKYLGDWRTNVLFVADDGDSDRHFREADGIAEKIRSDFPFFNVNKVYLDAYEEENTPGGVFNFNAKNALNQHLFQGQLVVNYIGHGGSRGWAQERVLQDEDIDKWENLERLPLLITATCSFAGYDDPSDITAGEFTLTNPDGGSVGLFTTVRSVYARDNERLTRNVFNHLFAPIEGRIPTIGESFINSKNTGQDTTNDNTRRFTLLGDPAMKLAIPQYKASTLTINGKPIADARLDTLKALSKVEVEGEIIDLNGNLIPGFNGKLYPTIFDKSVTLKTLGQGDDSFERTFELQKSVIFKGLASVTNGKFKFSFVVPKDINYSFGFGKISYYAEDGTLVDVAGSFDQVVVGGTDKNGINDEEGPDIQIFMDDENFVFGGITDSDPVLLLKLSDENGINVIGNSIGHDLTAVLDRDFQNTIQLNDFYESEQDDYTRGMVSYPLAELEPGTHTIEVKAWDIANNSSEALTEFLVVDDEEAALRHVLNYPNPFSNETCFQFEHPYQGQELEIRIEILTPSGRVVRTRQETIKASGNLSRDVKWDGRDEFGDPLANGIYIYRVSVSTQDSSGRILKSSSDLEKLVILR